MSRPEDPLTFHTSPEVDEQPQLEIRGREVTAHLFPRKVGNAVEGLHLNNDSLFNQKVQAVASNLDAPEAHRYRNFTLYPQAPQLEHDCQRPAIDRLTVSIPQLPMHREGAANDDVTQLLFNYHFNYQVRGGLLGIGTIRIIRIIRNIRMSSSTLHKPFHAAPTEMPRMIRMA